MTEIFELVLKSYGVIGFILLAPYGACVYLWLDTKSHRKELKAVNDARVNEAEKYRTELTQLMDKHRGELIAANLKVVDAQAQRVSDAQSIVSKMTEMVSETVAVGKETNIALERVGDAMTFIQASIASQQRLLPPHP